MNFFSYKDGMLSAEEVGLDHLAEKVGTPFYCYSSATLERHYKIFTAALPRDSLIAFSVKANGNLDVRFQGKWWEKPRRVVLHVPRGAGISSVTVNGKRHSARKQLEIDSV